MESFTRHPSGARAVILNQGVAAWAFEELANSLSATFDAPVSEVPSELNYVLACDQPEQIEGESVVPLAGINLAGDKRLAAMAFKRASVETPETVLCGSLKDVAKLVNRCRKGDRWVLKYPVGCGGAGHRLLGSKDFSIPANWPMPYVVQKFVPMERSEVQRVYVVRGEAFGWNRRYYPHGANASPWVSHSHGAVYELFGHTESGVADVALAAAKAVGLEGSFASVDVMQVRGGWLVLEVGTDGLFEYVDRDVPEPLKSEIDLRFFNLFTARLTTL